MKLNTILSEVVERRQEEETISYHSASFKGDISHGKTSTEKLKTENSLFLEQVLENLIRSPAAERGTALCRGAAAMINAICLNHYSAPWFSKHYEDGTVINDRGILPCFGLFLSATSPPSAPSFWTSLNPQKGRGVYLFSTRLPLCLLLFALKGTNSIHSCDIKALIQ